MSPELGECLFVNKAWNSCYWQYRNHEANVMPRTRQIDGSTYGINVIVIPQMLKSSFDSGAVVLAHSLIIQLGVNVPGHLVLNVLLLVWVLGPPTLHLQHL